MQTKLLFLFLIYFNSLVYCFSQGNGSDGVLMVATGTTTINTTATPVSLSNPIGTTINVGATTGFAIGNTVLVMQMQGTGAGTYDELTITGLTGTSLTFSSPTSFAYSNSGANLAQVIKIPQYTTVTVNPGATLNAPAWNGSTGGVLIYYASGAVIINGTLTMSAKGYTGGTGATPTLGGALGTKGNRGASNGANGFPASPGGGGNGGTSSAGVGGSGGIGTLPGVNLGSTGNGVGGGTSNVAGTNMSSGITKLVMGGGGGGGQGGQGGQGGGGGGGGGAASAIGFLGSNGSNGTVGTAATGIGGSGGTGGGVILMRIKSMAGNGTIVSNGTAGTSATGTGGKGGDGGNGGDGGGGLVLTNSGGGGGGGKAGQGGQGPGGGGGGGAGVIVILAGNPTAWTGSVTTIQGTGGTGGTGGAAGTLGTGGAAGFTLLTIFGSAGVAGTDGLADAAGLNGPNGTPSTPGQAPIVLPVELTSFSANVIDNKSINLIWQTSSEKNNAQFIIYKSTDGIHFKELATVSGAGNSNQVINYSLDDVNPSQGANYYKLVQVDFNGKETSYRIISIQYGTTDLKLAFYPNPVGEDKTLHILNEQSNIDGSLEITVLNCLGQSVYQETKAGADFNEFTVNLNNLSAGLYYLNVSSLSGTHTEKIIIR